MRKFFPLLPIFVFLLLWYFLADFKVINFVGPVESFKAFFHFLFQKDPITGVTLLGHAYASLKLVFLGTGLALFLGVILGLVMGWYKSFGRFLEPIIEIIRPIPGIAWFPIAIIFFGKNGSIFIVFICAFFHILINTIFGVEKVNKNLIDTARVLRAKEIEIIFKIIIPSSFPYILTGLRMGVGTGFLGLVSAEMISLSSVGLGFFILIMHSIGHTEKMVAGMMMIGIIGFFINKTLLKIGEFYKISHD